MSGYALTALISTIVPQDWGKPGAYRTVVVWAKLLLIPGMAALFCRILNGAEKWGRRTLVILPVAPLGLFVMITPFAVLAALLDWTLIVGKIVLVVALSVVFVALVAGLRWCVRSFQKWTAEAEKARWLAERRAGRRGSDERKWRNRGIRLAICVPTLVVLLVFLFLPEVWGVLSRLSRRFSRRISGYQVEIPATWIVLYHDAGLPNGQSWISGIRGEGIGLGGNPLRYDSLSGWSVGTLPFDGSDGTTSDSWMPQENDMISRRILRIESETVTCVDYRPTQEHRRMQLAHLTCLGSSRLVANFDGPRAQVPAFFRMLGNTRQVH